MNNKIKQFLVLLFVVSTLLLIIGSVSATSADELDENLETSVIADTEASVNDVETISNLDNKVSDHIATNDDETKGALGSADLDLKNLDSNTVVSNENDATINSKDSEKNALSANRLGSISFYISNNGTSPAKVDYDVYFDVLLNVYASNGENFTGKIDFQEWFDESELEYIDFIPNPCSDGSTHAEDYEDPVFVEDENGKYLLIGYNANNLINGDYLNFSVHFKTKKEGFLNNTVVAVWNTSDGPISISSNSSVFAGVPGIKIIKTPQEPVVDLGDDVYFDIYFENNGTIPYDSPYGMGSLIFNDWFDEGLEYVGYTVNPDKNGNMWEIQISLDFVEDPEMYGDRLVGTFSLGWDFSSYPFKPYTWDPGESLNITVHFKATKPGKWENHAQMWWKWKPWGSDETHEWIEPWGNTSVLVGQPKFTLEKISNYERVNVGDNASFTLIYTNTGTLNLTGVYIKDNDFTNGLKYLDYSDKELWEFDGTDTWYYNSILEPGDAATLEITFQATAAGEQNNTAVAGHNLTNETHNSTDTVIVVENDEDSVEEEDDIDDDDTDDEEYEDEEEEEEDEPDSPNPEKPKVLKKVSIPSVGNPLFVLLLGLISLCFVPLRGRK